MSEIKRIQPAIDLFTARAKQLAPPANAEQIERAVALLGHWMTKENRWLTKDDVSVLADVGASLVLAHEALGGDEDGIEAPLVPPVVPT